MSNWAAECFPQHRKTSGAAAVLAAAETARSDMRRHLTAERDAQVCDELDRIDLTDQHEFGKDW
ncbi:MAG: hypothetical protein VYA67_22170 [Actinomycetota bacterium]|nr:hypothetical protein [Actinomycetota bacterium]